MTSYELIPSVEGVNDSAPSPGSTIKNLLLGVSFAAVALVGFLEFYGDATPYGPEPRMPEPTGEVWPSVLYSSLVTVGSPTDTLKKHMPALDAPERPSNTAQAMESGWEEIPDSECVPELGYPWAFDGAITSSAPVTLYFSKGEDGYGVLTGIGVHYFDDSAPAESVQQGIFTKGTKYDTINMAFRDPSDDVCAEGLAATNSNPVVDILKSDGDRIHVPLTADDAETASWRKGFCLPGMGTHWAYDVVGGKEITWKAENLFPVQPMYHSTNGTLNGILFSATKKMQIWSESCPLPLRGLGGPTWEADMAACMPTSNMWDSGTGLDGSFSKNVLQMCANFYPIFDPVCPGFDVETMATMHFFLVPDPDFCGHNPAAPKAASTAATPATSTLAPTATTPAASTLAPTAAAPAAYLKKYTKKWPNCQNISCFPAKKTIVEAEEECNSNSNCSGFSFRNGALLGDGCLKTCGSNEAATGYGNGSYDYYEKSATL